MDTLCVSGEDGRQEDDPGVHGPHGPSEDVRIEEDNPYRAAKDSNNANPKAMVSEQTTPCSISVCLSYTYICRRQQV